MGNGGRLINNTNDFTPFTEFDKILTGGPRSIKGFYIHGQEPWPLDME
jgi:hypothetical protein